MLLASSRFSFSALLGRGAQASQLSTCRGHINEMLDASRVCRLDKVTDAFSVHRFDCVRAATLRGGGGAVDRFNTSKAGREA
jgi:hypothetical protein